ncbi:hypothetical protein NC652_003253 [Populus alba x Populus x berolinensis]|nr:hypothetical protein NC652_003253 [Populus alba x Populus x berolinensis]
MITWSLKQYHLFCLLFLLYTILTFITIIS